MRKLFAAFILTVLFSLPAPRALAASAQCLDLFKPTRKELVSDWLTANGIAPQIGKTNLILKIREALLLRRLDATQLENPVYRAWWIDRLADLKVAQKISPLDEFNISRRGERTAIRRLMIRSLLENGISEWLPEQSKKSDRLSEIKILARRIRLHPAARMILELKWPTGRTLLSESQITKILEDGTQAFENDPELAGLLKRETHQELIRKTNAVVFKLVLLAAVGHVEMVAWPKLEAAYDRGYEQSIADSTNHFKTEASSIGKFNGSDAIVALAKSQIQTILIEFKNRYREAPTAEEFQQIKTKVCLESLGDSLNESEKRQCLAL